MWFIFKLSTAPCITDHTTTVIILYTVTLLMQLGTWLYIKTTASKVKPLFKSSKAVSNFDFGIKKTKKTHSPFPSWDWQWYLWPLHYIYMHICSIKLIVHQGDKDNTNNKSLAILRDVSPNLRCQYKCIILQINLVKTDT